MGFWDMLFGSNKPRRVEYNQNELLGFFMTANAGLIEVAQTLGLNYSDEDTLIKKWFLSFLAIGLIVSANNEGIVDDDLKEAIIEKLVDLIEDWIENADNNKSAIQKSQDLQFSDYFGGFLQGMIGSVPEKLKPLINMNLDLIELVDDESDLSLSFSFAAVFYMCIYLSVYEEITEAQKSLVRYMLEYFELEMSYNKLMREVRSEVDDFKKFVESILSTDSDTESEQIESDAVRYSNILGVKGKVTKEEIRQLYRNKMKDYHPDKVNHLPKEFQELAHKKSLEIQEAYAWFVKEYNL